MATQIEIVNDALTNIGVRSIGSLQENSEAARKAAAKWPLTRDDVLRDCPWNFASMIQTLALAANDTIPGWNFAYVYPSKCLLVRRVFNAVIGEITSLASYPDWFAGMIERGEIKTDPDFREMIGPTSGSKLLVSQLQNALAEFTYQVVDPSQWDALFVRAMSFKLAAELAWPLTGNRELGGDLTQKYMAVLAEAKRVNAAEGQDKTQSRSTFVESRV